MINGAAGGVGTFGVQVARSFGAEVTGVCSTEGADLAVIRELMEAGRVTAVIDRRYRLREVPEAVRYLEQGHARGKVVITVDECDEGRYLRVTRGLHGSRLSHATIRPSPHN